MPGFRGRLRRCPSFRPVRRGFVSQDPRLSALHGEAEQGSSGHGLAGQCIGDLPRVFLTGPCGSRRQGHGDRAVLRGVKDHERIAGVDVAVGLGEEVHPGLAGGDAEEFRGQARHSHEEARAVLTTQQCDGRGTVGIRGQDLL